MQITLEKAGFTPFGLDESRQMVRQAGKRLSRQGQPNRLARGVAQHLPFAGETFDSVVATFPTPFIIDPQTLSEIHRVLKAADSSRLGADSSRLGADSSRLGADSSRLGAGSSRVAVEGSRLGAGSNPARGGGAGRAPGRESGRLVVLMTAWITGRSTRERLARWLFRVTGETPPEDLNLEKITAPYQEAGFETSIRFVELPGSRLMFIVARKPHKITNLL
jgi:hypothetical protein